MEEYERAQRSGELLQAVVCLDCSERAFAKVSDSKPAQRANESILDISNRYLARNGESRGGSKAKVILRRAG